MRLWLLGAVLCAMGASAADPGPSPGRDPAGPRLGTVYTVHVRLPGGRKDVDTLTDLGFDISNVDGDVATVHATSEELQWLKGNRYPVLVQWVNKDSVAHTVVLDSGPDSAFDSGDVAPGSSFSRHFGAIGTYQYHCRIHGSPGSGMSGTLVVQ